MKQKPALQRCPVCLSALPEGAPTGRPAVYCSERCRRERGQAMARARRRIARLEDERAVYERALELGAGTRVRMLPFGRKIEVTPRQALRNVEAALAREHARLLALDDEGEQP